MHALARRAELPDPRPGGPSGVPNWINPQAPAFLAAENPCSKFLGGGGSSASARESEKVALLDLAKCMRAHGLTNFPDPTTSPLPAPPPGSHTGNAVGIGGVYLVFPPQSPALKRADVRALSPRGPARSGLGPDPPIGPAPRSPRRPQLRTPPPALRGVRS